MKAFSQAEKCSCLCQHTVTNRFNERTNDGANHCSRYSDKPSRVLFCHALYRWDK